MTDPKVHPLRRRRRKRGKRGKKKPAPVATLTLEPVPPQVITSLRSRLSRLAAHG